MKNLNLIVLVGLCFVLAIFTPCANAEKLDWMPVQLDDQGLNSQGLGSEQIIPDIIITETPKPTADMAKYTKKYVLELKKFNISNDGTNPVETSKGINAALQRAKTLDVNYIVFPKGTYLISETDPIIIDHKNTIIDLNDATLQVNTNGLARYGIVEIVPGAENMRLTNGTLRGDRIKHDYSSGGTHAGGCCLRFRSGNNLEADHLTLINGTGDGVGIYSSGHRDRAGLLARIKYTLYPKEVEQGAFSDKGIKTNSTEKIRTIKPLDMTKCGDKFEFGYFAGYRGFPFIKGRVYQVYFYDKDMKFMEMKKCLQYRDVIIPEGVKFAHLEFNQPEIPEEPGHYGATKGWFGRITNLDPSTDVHFHHNKLIGNRRLGMAYSGGKKWIIEENYFENNGITMNGVRGTAPAYGIDLEDGMEHMQDVVIRNNRFKNNLNGDLVICAGTELLIEDNVFESNVVLHGRPHNYIFRNNTYTGGNVSYVTRTGVAKIHGNAYENCKVSIVFDTKAVADGFYRKSDQAVATPPLTLENATMTNVSRVTGTYFNFINSKLTNTKLVAGEKTRMVDLKNCQFDNVSLEYEAEGPDVHVKIEGCKGKLNEQGPGLKRKKLKS